MGTVIITTRDRSSSENSRQTDPYHGMLRRSTEGEELPGSELLEDLKAHKADARELVGALGNLPLASILPNSCREMLSLRLV